MPVRVKWAQSLAIFTNWLVALVFFALPHLFYLGTSFQNGAQPQMPFLATHKIWFYFAGIFLLSFTWIFWRIKKRALLAPILVYSFLTVFVALAQGSAFRYSIKEGLILYTFTVLPLGVVLASSFVLARSKNVSPMESNN